MKKYLPYILVAGALVVVYFLFLRKKENQEAAAVLPTANAQLREVINSGKVTVTVPEPATGGLFANN